jgi:hypothetical protein
MEAVFPAQPPWPLSIRAAIAMTDAAEASGRRRGDDTDSGRAIRWLLALMVLSCDPLAIALMVAASVSHERFERCRQAKSFKSIAPFAQIHVPERLMPSI